MSNMTRAEAQAMVEDVLIYERKLPEAMAGGQDADEQVETDGEELTEAAGKSFFDFLIGAQEAFLKDVAKGIKKVAGGHAESVNVKRAKSAVWLEYKGQDRSDMDLEVVFSLVVKEPSTTVYIDVKGVQSSGKRDASFRTGQLTTDVVVGMFREAFGR